MPALNLFSPRGEGKAVANRARARTLGVKFRSFTSLAREEGGAGGGKIVGSDTPANLAKRGKTHTARSLNQFLKQISPA